MDLVREMEYGAGKEFQIELALREALANAVRMGVTPIRPRESSAP